MKTLVAACVNVSNGPNYSLRSHAKDEQRLEADLARQQGHEAQTKGVQ
ncbi:hypothetical protein [Streptomyces xanthophaeus]|uniref:Uncharacterized protein n=1 Tax=Streptomyces xanthophaeus TaxID=67385 RepID=A0A919LIN0_9ACTN|nr:hypothetical protein [Streptomyces xanthophaeus]GHI89417.1 hypothetical protein Sxan_67810 [Streptomyces xanthophaeus]